MESRVQKWGNSQGLRLSKQVLHDAHIGIGETVEIIPQEGQIIIKKSPRRKFDLNEMVTRMPKGYKPQEENWGGAVGHEEW
jgi:antitoxin MazE